MAAPKKKKSKAKSRIRYAAWKHKIVSEAQKALSLGRSILSERNTGFCYPSAADDNNEEEQA